MYLGERAKRDCIRAGFEPVEHFKWLPPGTIYTSMMRARGDLVVDDEDIIILEKPKPPMYDYYVEKDKQFKQMHEAVLTTARI